VRVACGRYWLMNCPEAAAAGAENVDVCVTLADALYAELITVPYMAKFVVFARRRDETHGLVRVFVVTDDKLDKTLESHQRFLEVARSDDVEVRQRHANSAFHPFRVNKLVVSSRQTPSTSLRSGAIW